MRTDGRDGFPAGLGFRRQFASRLLNPQAGERLRGPSGKTSTRTGDNGWNDRS